MKITNGQVYNLYETLLKIKMKDSNKLPIHTAYKIIKIMKSLSNSYDSIIELRAKIIQEYQVKDKDSNYIIPPESISIVNAKMAELAVIENEIDLELCTLDELEKLELTLQEMDNLLIIVQEV